MTTFITDDFLLHGPTARALYREFAAAQPILDYHCHLPVRDIASDRGFATLAEVWLEGDHYKWRAMRANGVEERYCTGDAPPYEKFLAWARTVPRTLRNPLYHWTHLELIRYFDIDDLLNERTASSVWARANERLAAGDLTTRGILRRFNVRCVCTTDDPAESSVVQTQRTLKRRRMPRVVRSPVASRALARTQTLEAVRSFKRSSMSK